jgi:hypothetical protein
LKFEKYIELSKALQPIHHDYSLNRTFHVTFALQKRRTVAIGINSIKTHPNIVLTKWEMLGMLNPVMDAPIF